MGSDLERHQTELDQLNEVINKKDNEIKDFRTRLAASEKTREFEVSEIQKDKAALNTRLEVLEGELEEKTNAIMQITNQNEEATKEFADEIQQFRTEYRTQSRLVDLLKEQLSATKEQNISFSETIKSNKVNMEQLLSENVQLKSTE